MELEKTVTLRKPVKLGDMTYDKLDLREPTAGELEKASGATSDLGVVINLISIVAKVPRRVAEGLSQRDLQEASNFFVQFGDFPATGETSSQSSLGSTVGDLATRGTCRGARSSGGTHRRDECCTRSSSNERAAHLAR